MKPGQRPGQEAIAAKGRFAAFKWLILRRVVQGAVLGLFLVGPVAGWWLVKGNLASSLTLDVLPLTDPYVLVQTLVTGHAPEAAALLGRPIASRAEQRAAAAELPGGAAGLREVITGMKSGAKVLQPCLGM